MKPKTLILRTAGTNCDAETAYAFEQAGATTERVHINRLLQNPRILDDFQILAVPGGFSYGDDIAAGRILANQILHHLRDPFHDFVRSGRPVIGVCNGFQVLVKTDLLPGRVGPAGDAGAGAQSATLTNNDCGRFVDRWVSLKPVESKCIWTKNLSVSAREASSAGGGAAGVLELPVAHGEGKFVVAKESVRRSLWDNGQVALVYTKPDGTPAAGQFPDNPNGSVDDIAGVCDDTGLVFGLMPHPERYVDPIQHPAWTRTRTLPTRGQGYRFFANAVDHAKQALGAGV